MNQEKTSIENYINVLRESKKGTKLCVEQISSYDPDSLCYIGFYFSYRACNNAAAARQSGVQF